MRFGRLAGENGAGGRGRLRNGAYLRRGGTFSSVVITLPPVIKDAEPSDYATPPIVAALGWLVPGLGYWMLGQKRRALLAGVTILFLFLFGLLISGIRCIDVPGYDANGSVIYVKEANGTKSPLITGAPFRAVLDKPWYIPQILAGPLTIGSSFWSVSVASAKDMSGFQAYPKATARMFDIGTLYTAIAGMLNLLIIIDSAYRAAKVNESHSRRRTI